MGKRIIIAMTGTLALSLAAGLFAPAAHGAEPNYASVKGPKQGQLKPGSTKTNLSSKNLKLMRGAGAGKPQLRGLKPPANDGTVSGKTAAGFNRGIGQPPP
jgi:hypothetical protein